MTRLEKIKWLNDYLLKEMPEYGKSSKSFENTEEAQRKLLRSLMNVRRPSPLSEEFIKIQDILLTEEVEEKGVVSISGLTPIKSDSRLYLWKGDITTLGVGAIVNAANSGMVGCFMPCHACIDNVIHSQAGLQLREECGAIMEEQGHEEETGKAKITPAYNLPSEYILHTVGPIIYDKVGVEERMLLKSSYKSCLKLALQKNIDSIAFCCISTGEFRFPNDIAAEIAVATVKEFLAETDSKMKVIFNVFKEKDYEIYRGLLGEDC